MSKPNDYCNKHDRLMEYDPGSQAFHCEVCADLSRVMVDYDELEKECVQPPASDSKRLDAMGVEVEESQGLKACPFCGGEAKLSKVNLHGWYVRCAKDTVICVMMKYVPTQQEAITAWNTRASDSALLNEVLEEGNALLKYYEINRFDVVTQSEYDGMEKLWQDIKSLIDKRREGI